MSLVHAHRVGKRFGERPVLADLSFTVESGGATAIIGPSGCGKSTLLRCIVGLESFDEGRITVGDVSLEATASERDRRATLVRVRSKVGLVFQGLHLFPHRTALENVTEAPIHVRGDAPAAAETRARELLELVGLGHRVLARPGELSGGEQQRVAIARALAMDPAVLLLDEPTSALDPARRREVTTTLRKLTERGITIVVVTHEMSFAREVSDRVVVMHGGSVVEEGATRDVFASPTDPRTRALLDPAGGG